MSKAVRFEQYGGIDVLQVVDVPRPVPGDGEVLVRVRAAGINPGEAAIRTGALHARWPATFPSGQGSDLAGVVEQVGSGRLDLPIARTYPLDDVRDAFADLERRHTRGKIVLLPGVGSPS